MEIIAPCIAALCHSGSTGRVLSSWNAMPQLEKYSASIEGSTRVEGHSFSPACLDIDLDISWCEALFGELSWFGAKGAMEAAEREGLLSEEAANMPT